MKILWGHKRGAENWADDKRQVAGKNARQEAKENAKTEKPTRSIHGPGKTGFFCVNSGVLADETKNDSFCPNCAGNGQYKTDGKLKPCPVCAETGIKEI